jgi:hypothetical protein
MQSYNTRPNPNTKFGSNQSEAKKETHAQAECLQERERERFRPNSVGQSIKREKRREEKIKNDNPNLNSTPFIIARMRMNVDFKNRQIFPPRILPPQADHVLS